MSPVSPLFGRSIKYSVIRFSIYSVLRIRSNGPPRGQTAKLIIIWYNFGVNHIPLQRNGMAAIAKIDKINNRTLFGCFKVKFIIYTTFQAWANDLIGNKYLKKSSRGG